MKLLVCHHLRRLPAGSCAAGGSVAIAQELARRLAEAGCNLPIEGIDCFGRCEQGPVLRLAPGGPFHDQVDKQPIDELFAQLLAECASHQIP